MKCGGRDGYAQLLGKKYHRLKKINKKRTEELLLLNK